MVNKRLYNAFSAIKMLCKELYSYRNALADLNAAYKDI